MRRFSISVLLLLLLTLHSFGVEYVRSTDGSDSDDGSTWALAHATTADAALDAAAGDLIYVSDNHAETQATALTITSPGTAASPVRVICVDDSAEPPTALATTATISTTGTTNLIISGIASGHTHYEGITFNAGTGAGNVNLYLTGSGGVGTRSFKNCKFNVLATGSLGAILATGGGATTALCELDNCTLGFGAVGQTVSLFSGSLVWRNTASAITGTVPTTLFAGGGSSNCNVEISGVDLSAAGSGKNLISVAANPNCRFLLSNCKLGSSVAIATGTHPGFGGPKITVVNSDSADTNYRYHYQDYTGTITQEITIVRTGGGSDGTTPISYTFVTTPNSKHYAPLYGPWVTFWNETVGSAITVAAEVATNNVTLTDAEAWIEVEYDADVDDGPKSTITSDKIADPIFGTPANQTTSSATWANVPGTPVKQTLSVQVTPQEKGPIRARVVLAKPSTTVYVDALYKP